MFPSILVPNKSQLKKISRLLFFTHPHSAQSTIPHLHLFSSPSTLLSLPSVFTFVSVTSTTSESVTSADLALSRSTIAKPAFLTPSWNYMASIVLSVHFDYISLAYATL